ncbi:MAG: phosphate signaling complex protein PhoU [Thermoplasmata archaeon]
MTTTIERKALEEGLAQLGENMVTLAELAQVAIRKAVESLGSTADGTEDVIAIDREVFGLKQAIVKRCVDLIALHQPVARDLRAVTASLEITTDLDRIGRYSRDIVELTRSMSPAGKAGLKQLPKLNRMGELTIRMIDVAVDAFLHRDAEPVKNIIEEDDAVDDLYDEVFRDIVTRMADRTLSPEIGAEMILINRYFERLADHAVNIGDHVVYMVTARRLTRIKRPTSGLALGRTP